MRVARHPASPPHRSPRHQPARTPRNRYPSRAATSRSLPAELPLQLPQVQDKFPPLLGRHSIPVRGHDNAAVADGGVEITIGPLRWLPSREIGRRDEHLEGHRSVALCRLAVAWRAVSLKQRLAGAEVYGGRHEWVVECAVSLCAVHRRLATDG